MERMDAQYGVDPPLFLKSENPWQLLFATILSAQCTDARVNEVTGRLFQKYKDLQSFADAELSELEEDVKSTGFYHNKARNIKACAEILLRQYDGIVPDQIEELVKLSGVGRKTGNLILGNCYDKPSLVVDTHVKRVSNRLGLADSPEPAVVEKQLETVLPEEYWIRWNHHIISLGRTYCRSLRPDCAGCYLSDLCPSRDHDPMTWRPRKEREKYLSGKKEKHE